ncbi:uncharacterized protein JN550_000887 [Neoarthrinium moseri]|uniref:uncharacterized protein n=1 Tax=Neoarthrinium moseri TaxID=1658444 RepID=UPI001FDD01F9|nr:uncharacterized protein JN550_000887 [Neoarthrinium moseri]KAI1876815.1 hypothetical protein JN550_000887 [Neoarthrinium moseri]
MFDKDLMPKPTNITGGLNCSQVLDYDPTSASPQQHPALKSSEPSKALELSAEGLASNSGLAEVVTPPICSLSDPHNGSFTLFSDDTSQPLHEQPSSSQPLENALTYLPDELKLDDLSDEQLETLFDACPVFYEIGGNKLVRISKNLIIKGGHFMSKGQAETQKFASSAGLPVPAVHRYFARPRFDLDWPDRTESWFMVMDFIEGQNLHKLWPSMDEDARKEIVNQVAGIVTHLQSIPVDGLPPGPVREMSLEPWIGPWFSEYGAGPFSNIEDMEDWYNHKIDVCLRFNQAPPDIPRFDFERLVLTHQDLMARNIILEKDSNRLVLVDWGHSGVYPIGFEQAALCRQCADEWDHMFGEAVWEALPDRRSKEIRQLNGIAFGLTAAPLM